jgi:hypothetical protein
VLGTFAAVFITLAVTSYTRESAVLDEPNHLTAGYTALKLHDFRMDPAHPPFVRMWAASPLLLMSDISLDTEPEAWSQGNYWSFSHGFLHRANDADRLLGRARFMIVLLGVLLGILLFSWVRGLFGLVPAVCALALYTMEPNILTHSRLVTTDLGMTCFAFGSVYFLWRCCRRLSPGNLAGLLLFFGIAQVSKFSAPLLGPVMLLLLVLHACRNAPWQWVVRREGQVTARPRKLGIALAVVVLLALVSFVTIWATYGFRHRPTSSEDHRYETTFSASDRHPMLTGAVNWADQRRLLPNTYLKGFFYTYTHSRKRPGYLAGEHRDGGWWYYFPVAFLVKTPISVILLFLGGLALCAARFRTLLANELFVLLPIAVFLAAVMQGGINIGLRHILPIYPFVLLLCAKAMAELLRPRRWPGHVLLVALGCLAAGELARVAPHYMAFFNGFVGGPEQGHRYLVDSNLDWGQDLKGLKRWMDSEGVEHINLCYFGSADPAFYDIDCTYLTGSTCYSGGLSNTPRLPGYMAISATHLMGAYFVESARGLYEPLRSVEPVASIGHSIRIYWLESAEWWTVPRQAN